MALVLTRRRGERIVIDVGGERVFVAVARIKSKTAVHLAIEAAPGVAVHREEVLDAGRASEGEQAARSAAGAASGRRRATPKGRSAGP